MASDMALEVIGDVAIVWFLSPQLRLGSLPSSGFARWTRSLPASAVQVRPGDPVCSLRLVDLASSPRRRHGSDLWLPCSTAVRGSHTDARHTCAAGL